MCHSGITNIPPLPKIVNKAAMKLPMLSVCSHYRPLQLRRFSTTSSTPTPDPSPPPNGIREYHYHVDAHGQLFLWDVKPKNFSSCECRPASAAASRTVLTPVRRLQGQALPRLLLP